MNNELYMTHFDNPSLKLFRVIDVGITSYTLARVIEYYNNHADLYVKEGDDDVYEFKDADLDTYIDELDDNEVPTGNKLLIRQLLADANEKGLEFEFLLGWEM